MLKKLIIDRKRWIRGRPEHETGLQVGDGMCCLGFLAEACGVSEGARREASKPSRLPIEEQDKMPFWLHGPVDPDSGGRQSSAIANALMYYNDHPEFSDETREFNIQNDLAKHGVEVVFHD